MKIISCQFQSSQKEIKSLKDRDAKLSAQMAQSQKEIFRLKTIFLDNVTPEATVWVYNAL